MDLTDEQWSVVSSIMPELPKRWTAGVVLGVVAEWYSMVFCGNSEPVHLSMTLWQTALVFLSPYTPRALRLTRSYQIGLPDAF